MYSSIFKMPQDEKKSIEGIKDYFKNLYNQNTESILFFFRTIENISNDGRILKIGIFIESY